MTILVFLLYVLGMVVQRVYPFHIGFGHLNRNWNRKTWKILEILNVHWLLSPLGSSAAVTSRDYATGISC